MILLIHSREGRIYLVHLRFSFLIFPLKKVTNTMEKITEPSIKPNNTRFGFVKDSVRSSFTFTFLLNSQFVPLYFPLEKYMFPPSDPVVPIFKYGVSKYRVFSAC